MSTSKLLNTFSAEEGTAIDTCATCPKLCRWACPVAEAEARETSTPWNLATMAGMLKGGRIEPESMGDTAFHCSHCGACTEACLHDNNVPLIVTLARARLLSARVVPKAVTEILGGFGSVGNPYGVSLEGELTEILRLADTQEGELASQTEPGTSLYFPGCATVHEAPDAAIDFLRAVRVRGISGVSVSEASAGCCGLPLLWAGDLSAFKAHAERQVRRLEGAERVVVHDAACASGMDLWYRALDVSDGPEIVHTAEFFAEALGVNTPKPSGEEDTETSKRSAGEPNTAYGDSCSLARGLRLIQTPRRLVERATGQRPVELEASIGTEVDCCGASGLLPKTAPRTASQMGEARIQSFKATGAERLVLCSPRCVAHLKRIDPAVDVVDVTHILARL